MTNLPEKKIVTLPASSDADNILREAQRDASFSQMMKFKKGVYYVDNQEVPLGTQYVAHAVGWAKVWTKFQGGKFVERKVYRIPFGESPPDRNELGDLNQDQWDISEMTRQPKDPWVLQNFLPLENSSTGDQYIFVTGTSGGQRAVTDLTAAWARKFKRDVGCGQPIVRLRTVMMPSKRFGNVPRPHFEIVGWDGGEREPVREVAPPPTDDMNDEIPF